MNKKWKEGVKKVVKKPTKNSPVMFGDEEVGTSTQNDVRTIRLSGTPRTKSYAGHSTPIKPKHKTESSDSPDLTYGESPIEPLTQNPPNEVGWDYQRALLKEEQDVKSSVAFMEINRTPKRSSDLLSKKRNSNSPLLYKPLKKKLIQEEQQENILGFMADLKAIEIKTNLNKDEGIENVPKTDNNAESQLVVEIDSQPSGDSDIKLQVSANSDDSIGHQNKVTVKNTNYDALLDDSIEDIMVLCSQEVEAKEFGTKIMHSVPNTSGKTNIINLSKSPDNGLAKMFNNLAKENVQPVNVKDKINSDISSEKSLGKESGSLEIPDDSFDEFFVGIDEKDFCKNTEIIINSTNKSIETNKNAAYSSSSTTTKLSAPMLQNKFFQSKKPASTAPTKSVTTTSTTSVYTPRTQSSSVPIQNKIINTKANFGYLNRDYAKNSSGYESLTSQNINVGNSTKLVKAKSFSDSDYLEKNGENNFGNCRSKSHLNSIQNQWSGKPENWNEASSSNKFCSTSTNKSWRRTNSTSVIDDKNKMDVDSLNNAASYSNAEIERKRQEALTKRRAKMKSDNTTQNRQFQDFVKR